MNKIKIILFVILGSIAMYCCKRDVCKESEKCQFVTNNQLFFFREHGMLDKAMVRNYNYYIPYLAGSTEEERYHWYTIENINKKELYKLQSIAFNRMVGKYESEKMSRLPKDIFRNLDNLEFIYLLNLGIKKLHKDQFRGLKKLKHLVLDGNDLKSIPSNIFNDLINLEELTLSENYLRYLPKNIFIKNNKLTTLWISHNSGLKCSNQNLIFWGVGKNHINFSSKSCF